MNDNKTTQTNQPVGQIRTDIERSNVVWFGILPPHGTLLYTSPVDAQGGIDAKRLDFMCHNELQMVMSRDGDVCTIWKWNDEHERVPYWGYPQRWFDSTREAIDAAMI